MKRPNFLVIMTDQQRTDTVGSYGAPICRSPATDRLAGAGTQFDNAFSVCALCTPARASIYTGVYPHRHGLIRNSEDPFCRTEFDSHQRLLPHYFSSAGYTCGFIGKWHCGIERLPRDFGFEGMNVPGYGKPFLTEEFKTYLEERGLEEGGIEVSGGGWQGNIVLVGTRKGPVEASVPYFLAEKTIEMIREYKEQERPFVLFSNFWGPHAPYLPTEPYASMYDPKSIPPWGNFYESFQNKPNAHKRYRDAFKGVDGTLRSWEECSEWAAKYYGFSTMIDSQIGRILDEVETLGMRNDTVIIFSTDHGDLLGAHGGMHDKCSIMCQETYHIPFIIRVPGVAEGAKIDEPITNMDILPTMLDLAGIKTEKAFDGRSIVPLLRNPGGADWEEDVMCEFNGHHYHYQSRMVTDGRFKYVFNVPEIDELYDLEKDPWETNNLAVRSEYKDRLQHMRRRLIHHAEKSADTLVPWMRNLFIPRQKEYTEYGAGYRA